MQFHINTNVETSFHRHFTGGSWLRFNPADSQHYAALVPPHPPSTGGEVNQKEEVHPSPELINSLITEKKYCYNNMLMLINVIILLLLYNCTYRERQREFHSRQASVLCTTVCTTPADQWPPSSWTAIGPFLGNSLQFA